jgi:hypothetical protein
MCEDERAKAARDRDTAGVWRGRIHGSWGPGSLDFLWVSGGLLTQDAEGGTGPVLGPTLNQHEA